jgi:hypothetical protein
LEDLGIEDNIKIDLSSNQAAGLKFLMWNIQGIKQKTVHSTDVFAVSSRTEQNTNITATCLLAVKFHY